MRWTLGRGRVVGLAVVATASLSALGAATTSRAAVVRSVALHQLPDVAHKLSAYRGYVVFSQLTAVDEWHLILWHAGSTTTLPVGRRQLPFDAEVGPAADGRPALVYSECAKDPASTESEQREYAPPNWSESAGCRIYQLGLPHGRPVLVKGIYSPGASDSTPAIWNGDIAFARHRPGSTTASIYLWHHTDRHVVRLGGGPASCPANSDIQGMPLCEKPVPGLFSWVDGMSLGSAGLAYEWVLQIPRKGAGPFAEPELRLDPLRSGRQSGSGRLISTGFVSGTCGGVEGVSPSEVGNNVLYALTFGDCATGEEELFSRFASYSGETLTSRTAAPLDRGLVVAVAQDHGTTYWIKDVLREDRGPEECNPGTSACGGGVFFRHADCDPYHGSCTLMRTDGLRRALRWP
jgi:hypothetical protein